MYARNRNIAVLMVMTTSLLSIAHAQQNANLKLEFEAASVRLDDKKTSSSSSTNVPLDSEDAFSPTGGLYMAQGFPLSSYIAFAYKQLNTPALQDQLPKWSQNAVFSIQARAAGNPTKDQYREMMRALLAERFKLQAHMETRKIRFFALVLAKPEKLGPQLRVHSAADSCSGSPTITRMGTVFENPAGGADRTRPETLVGVFPTFCGGVVAGLPVDPENMPGFFMAGGRGMSMDLIADFFSMRAPRNNLDRLILDRTGLPGKYDFIIEWSSPPASNAATLTSGPSMPTALREQLGLKLEPTEGPVDILIIDHVEQPTEN
jgi:uncharacterized protein (TIGR03435 family)